MDEWFLHEEDARTRLNHTVIRYDGEPMFIAIEDEVAHIRPLGRSSGWQEIDWADRRLDHSSPPLGFVNKDGTATYVQRNPDRRWQASVHDGNCVVEVINKGDCPPRLFDSRAFGDMIKGEYPSYEEARDIALGYNACAFSRHLAVDNRERLWCAKRRIGIVRDGEIVRNVGPQS